MSILFNKPIQLLSALANSNALFATHVARVCKSVVFMNFDLSYDLTLEWIILVSEETADGSSAARPLVVVQGQA